MSWDQYRDILDNAQREHEVRASTPPDNCPNDGTTLEGGPDGELHCPFDGWIWQGEPVTW